MRKRFGIRNILKVKKNIFIYYLLFIIIYFEWPHLYYNTKER